MKMEDRPSIRGQESLEKELEGHDFISDELMLRWDDEGYSVSGYHRMLYSIVKGLKAKTIVEVGFGRTSYCLAKAASELNAQYFCCDNRDLAYLFSKEEQKVVRFIFGTSEKLWNDEKVKKTGIDFAFLDHFSSAELPFRYCLLELEKCLKLLNPGGMILFHDAADNRYPISRVIKHLKKKKNIEVLTLPYNQGMGCIHYSSGEKPILSYTNKLAAFKKKLLG